jgi:hypothetical protein
VLTWAVDDPEGRADAGGTEGSTSWEREGAAGGNGEDAAAAFCGVADTGKGEGGVIWGFEGAACCCPGRAWGTWPPSIAWKPGLRTKLPEPPPIPDDTKPRT